MSKTASSSRILSDDHQTSAELKDYAAPELTVYGDISSLVRLVVVNGADGGAPPFQAQS